MYDLLQHGALCLHCALAIMGARHAGDVTSARTVRAPLVVSMLGLAGQIIKKLCAYFVLPWKEARHRVEVKNRLIRRRQRRVPKAAVSPIPFRVVVDVAAEDCRERVRHDAYKDAA